jgi:hypothetical protein
MEKIMNNIGFLLLILAIIILFAVSILLIFITLSKKKHQNVGMNFLQSFIDNYKPTLGIEKNLDLILLKTQELVMAPNYCFYIYNPANQKYTLKAVRQLTTDTNIAPSYSGLVPYEKEKFDPSISLPADSVCNFTDNHCKRRRSSLIDHSDKRWKRHYSNWTSQ